MIMDGFGVFDDMNDVPGFEGNGGFFSQVNEFNTMHTFGTIFIGAVFVIIAVTIGYAIISGLRSWSSNNASPLLTLHSTVVAKRTNVSGGAGDTGTSTSYFLTFELDNGERMEFRVSGSDYGRIVEQDQGMLTFQGTRFKHFEREEQAQSDVGHGQF